MIRTYLFSGLLTLLFFTSNAQQNYSVSGKLIGFAQTNQPKVILRQYNGINYSTYDSTLAAFDDSFHFHKNLSRGFFQLDIPSQGISNILYADGQHHLNITIENNKYQTDRFHFSDTENCALSELLNCSQQLQITLNTLNEKFNPAQIDSFYMTRLAPHNLKVLNAYKAFNSQVDTIKNKYPNTVVAKVFCSFYKIPLFDEDSLNSIHYDNEDAYLRDHFFDFWNLNDERIVPLPIIKSNIEKYFKFFSIRKSSWLIQKSDELLNRAGNERVKNYLASLLIDFFTQVKENDVVEHIVETDLHGCLEGIDLSHIHFMQNNLIGTAVSELSLPDDHGQSLKLSDVYRKAEFTVLYFWSTSCSHCRDLHPIMKTLKQKYGKDLAVYDVCIAGNESEWQNTLAEFGMYQFNNVWVSLQQREQIKQLFDIHYTPLILIINSEGNIVDKDLYSDTLEDSLSKLLDK